MKIRRANVDEIDYFSRDAFQRRLAYTIEDKPKQYVEFKIFDDYKATLSKVDEKWIDDLIASFRFHNGFVYEFYGPQNKLIKKFPKVERIAVRPDELGVTQWVVSEKKLAEVNQWIAVPDDVVIPVFSYQNRLIALDGHTRLKAALHWELPYIYVYKETGDGLSKAFYNASLRRDIVTAEDIEVINEQRYHHEWDSMCDEFIRMYNEKERLRKETFKLRENIDHDTHQSKNQALIKRLLGLLSTHHLKRIGVFYPIGNEVDLRVIDGFYQTFYPLIEGGKLVFAPNIGTFKKAEFNTTVPDTEQRLLGQLDAVIVPGLLFDHQGYRLGYGKGYYDGFLKDYKGLKIGVCFDQFIIDSLPIENHDKKVDYTVTDTQIIEVRACIQR